MDTRFCVLDTFTRITFDGLHDCKFAYSNELYWLTALIWYLELHLGLRCIPIFLASYARLEFFSHEPDTIKNTRLKQDNKKLRTFQLAIRITRMQHRMIICKQPDPSQACLIRFGSFSLVLASNLSNLSLSPLWRLEIILVICERRF